MKMVKKPHAVPLHARRVHDAIWEWEMAQLVSQLPASARQPFPCPGCGDMLRPRQADPCKCTARIAARGPVPMLEPGEPGTIERTGDVYRCSRCKGKTAAHPAPSIGRNTFRVCDCGYVFF